MHVGTAVDRAQHAAAASDSCDSRQYFIGGYMARPIYPGKTALHVMKKATAMYQHTRCSVPPDVNPAQQAPHGTGSVVGAEATGPMPQPINEEGHGLHILPLSLLVN